MEHPLSPLIRTLAALGSDPATLNADFANQSFLSRGRDIEVDIFHPRGISSAPAIVVLHGAGGMDHGNSYVRQLAAAFAANGYATFLPRYFQSTGTTYASDATIDEHVFRWLEVVNDAVSFASGHSKIDNRRVSLIGYSLGAYLAVAQAAHDPRVHALIELAGGVDPDFAESVMRLPPTLIIHGEDDQRVKIARARELELLLHKVNAHAETRYYPGEGHILSSMALVDALAHGLEFLRKHLGPG